MNLHNKISGSVVALGFLLTTNVFAMEGQDPGLRGSAFIPSKPKRELKQGAQEGNADAQYELGMLYKKGGVGVVIQEPKKALPLFEKAADAGHIDAQIVLARMLLDLDKEGIPQNSEKALKHIKKLIKQDIPQGKCLLAWMYAEGVGVPKNEIESNRLYIAAAEQGDAKAQYNLGQMHDNGTGVPKNVKKAMEWYQKSAEQGDIEAQYCLAWGYHFGSGVKKNKKKAMELYQRPSEQGHRGAQLNLGVLCQEKKKYKLALELYEKAAAQGCEIAQKNIGNLYRFGRGVKRDRVQAKYWFEKAAAQGDLDSKKIILEGLY
ncbi:MAG TPA: SEL1-like repeat protein [Alphaproteobacteria bacterium]|nr:SEL1-like repeat protein [Alphaproteobacteria bacterium]